MKTQKTWQYNCKSARIYRAKRKFKTYISTFIVCYTLITGFMAVNAYFGLTDDITSQHTAIAPIQAVSAQNMPIVEPTIEQQIRAIAKEKNFKWENYLVHLADCESKLNQFALNNNGSYGIDRGVFQINTKYHPEVSTECSMNIRCATEWTIKRINDGHQSEWMCDKIVNK